MRTETPTPLALRFLKRLVVSGGAIAMTLGLFLILPVIQAITEDPPDKVLLTGVDDVSLPPPPPPPEMEEPEPEPEEEPPPEMSEEAPPLDLSMLELALDGGIGDGFMGGDFAVSLGNLTGGGADVQELFSLAELDQEPRPLSQPPPSLSAKERKRTPGQVVVIFIVDAKGKVTQAKVRSSTDPILERPALAAVKQWKFEPGKRNGEPVSSRMMIPITFPES